MIEDKLQWLSANEWRNYEFNELSEKILDSTGINLSATTLKRIFGKLKYESLPSSVTLNALANYLGYENWMDFKSKQSNGKEIKEEVISITKEGTNIKKDNYRLSRKVLLAVAASAFLIIIFGFVFLSKRTAIAPATVENIVFKSRSLAEGLPNTVLFNFDLKGITSDKIRIQQYWDTTKTITIKPGQTEATGFYYMPGYFRAKLIVDGKILKQHDLFIKADKWMATIDHEPIPTYLKKDELILNNNMTVSESILKEIKKISTPTPLTYHLVRPFGGLQSDNFTLETSIKNIYADGAAVCASSKVFVLCSKGAFIIPFSIPGCVGNINLKLSERYYEGRSNDLSRFGADLSLWNKVIVEVKNRNVKIFLNGTLVREETYKEDAGEVVGLRFGFLGAGAVGQVKLLDGNKGLVYDDEFK